MSRVLKAKVAAVSEAFEAMAVRQPQDEDW